MTTKRRFNWWESVVNRALFPPEQDSKLEVIQPLPLLPDNAERLVCIIQSIDVSEYDNAWEETKEKARAFNSWSMKNLDRFMKEKVQ